MEDIQSYKVVVVVVHLQQDLYLLQDLVAVVMVVMD